MDVDRRGVSSLPGGRKTWSEDAGHTSGSENTAVFWLESTDCRKESIRDQLGQEGGTVSRVRSWDFHSEDPTAGVSEPIRCPLHHPGCCHDELGGGGAMDAAAPQGQPV